VLHILLLTSGLLKRALNGLAMSSANLFLLVCVCVVPHFRRLPTACLQLVVPLAPAALTRSIPQQAHSLYKNPIIVKRERRLISVAPSI